jgi:hypothetical protein
MPMSLPGWPVPAHSAISACIAMIRHSWRCSDECCRCAFQETIPCIRVEIRGSTNGELQLLYRLPMASRSVGVSIGSALFVDTRHGKEGYSDDITSYDAQGIILTGGVSWMMMPKLSIEGRAELPGGSTLPVVAGHRMMPAEWVERR